MVDRDALSEQAAVPPKTGFHALSIVAGLLHHSIDAGQLARALGKEGQRVTTTDILLAAKAAGLRASARSVDPSRIARISAPFIAELSDGRHVVVLSTKGDQVVAVMLPDPKPKHMTPEAFAALWHGRVVLVKTPLRLGDANRRFDLFWFLPVLWKFRKTLAEVLIGAFAIQVFALATPFFTQVVIDKVLTHRSFSTLHVLAAGMLALIVFDAIVSVLKGRLLTHSSSRIEVVLGGRLFSHLLRIPLRYFELRRVGDTVARARELDQIRQFLTGQPLTTAIDVLFVFVFLAVMAYYSLLLTGVVLLALPVMAAITLLLRPVLRRRLEEMFDRGAESQSFLVECVSGMQTVKAMALEPNLFRKWETLLARHVTASFGTRQLANWGSSIGKAVQRLTTLAILWVGATLVMDGELSVGQLIAFQMLAGQVITPAMRMVQLWQEFQRVALSVERLGDLMNTPAEPSLMAGRSAMPPIRGHITLESVRFRYRSDGPEIVKNLGVDIRPGTTVGLVGRSGSGKSTLAKLLQRLYTPESGRILIDGVDIAQTDPSWLRRQIGVVLQESFLFSGTVRDNIAIQAPHMPMSHVVRAATLANAHEFIVQLPEGYDTQVGERGAALSGGQRQRIAIARALLSDPRILIFDEATSALDYESERLIQQNLAEISDGRTVLIIAHRLSTLRHADLILVMDRGELVEQGTHDELVAKHGLYHHLYAQQERVRNGGTITQIQPA
jgi:ATP-binding cassette, subfamily B, bacterial HlyB/CyaB